MDIILAKTFLEIIAAGSFVNAARQLNVTQSAVSLRVRRLEELLGQTLFDRAKSGTTLTPAGRMFERFARSMTKVWEEARYQVSVPEGYRERLVVGGQYSLLPQFTMQWLSRMEKRLPKIAFRVETGMADRLMRQMVEGVLDIAVMYRPQLRPGLSVEQILDGELVMVSAQQKTFSMPDETYIYMDWGDEFNAAHNSAFPDLQVPRTTFAVGALGLDFVMSAGRSAYFPARLVRDHIEAGRLHLVKDAPSFPNPVFVVYQNDLADTLLLPALEELRVVAKYATQASHDVLTGLTET